MLKYNLNNRRPCRYQAGKKGATQTNAASVASLIAIIALFMLVLILLMPKEERHELLGVPASTGAGTNLSKVILSEYLGKVSPSTKAESIKHAIQPINLFIEEEKEIISLSGETTIKKSLFTSVEREYKIELNEPENVKELSLYFLVKDSSGNLVIKLNDIAVFEGRISSGEQQVLVLPLDYLKNTNKIKFIVGSPGIRVYATDFYDISFIKARKVYNIINNNVERMFSIQSSELAGTVNALLSYDCISDKQDKVRIYLNSRIIFNSYLVCDSELPIEIDKSYLKQGANILTFETTAGSYLVSDIKLETISEEKGYPEYYFKIDDEDYKEIKFGNLDAIISLFLYGEDKKLNIFINENRIGISTTESTYLASISRHINKGDNLLRIEPLTDFEIVSLKVEVV